MATLQPHLIAVHPPAPASARAIPGWLLPIALVVLLTTAWTFQHWTALSAGRLPDTDDMMRLAQIRDWLGGQRFSDLSQHRLGLGGLAMHWSRIGDIGPAALMVGLGPFVGPNAAELAAIIIWPASLLVALLLIVRRIAFDLEGPALVPIATVLAALAYPTIAFFMPGRIDHHGLQAVLVAAVAAALTAPASRTTGFLGGVAVSVSLILGLEAVPLLLAAMAGLGFAWAFSEGREDDRVGGFAAGLGLSLPVMLLLFRPDASSEGWCDAVTPTSVRLMLLLAGGWSLIALAGRCVRTGRGRATVAAIAGVVLAAGALAVAPSCFTGPYGPVDPMVKRLWMSNVAEAGPLFGLGGAGLAWAQGGLIAAGVAVLGVRVGRDRRCWTRWQIPALMLVAGAAGMVVQIRMTYLAAVFAVLPLAWLVLRARSAASAGRAGTVGLLAAWLFSAGIVHAAAGQRLSARGQADLPRSSLSCTSVAAMRAASALPPGLVAAPMDAGAYLIGMTRHQVLAAPYHRNNDGNRLLYTLLLAPPEQARMIAISAGVDHFMLCADELAELAREPGWPTSLAAALLQGKDPNWVGRVSAYADVTIVTVRPFRTPA